MIEKKIAIIPARSGSKGLPNKNIKILNGKPLLAYTIEAALQSRIFDCVHVSTDSEVYAQIAKEYGASVPFLRTNQNSMDKSSTWDVVNEVLDQYHELGEDFDMFTVLQPTSPLRDFDDIKKAYDLLLKKDAGAIISVCQLEHPLEWCGTLNKDLSLDNFIKENAKQRQNYQKEFRLNGAIYMVKKLFYQENHNIYRQGAFAYIMDAKKSIDIDDAIDFDFAQYLIKSKIY